MLVTSPGVEKRQVLRFSMPREWKAGLPWTESWIYACRSGRTDLGRWIGLLRAGKALEAFFSRALCVCHRGLR
jgi:hypothetical protein